jgi:hypothetical protein
MTAIAIMTAWCLLLVAASAHLARSCVRAP